jgi:hypothetical protein
MGILDFAKERNSLDYHEQRKSYREWRDPNVVSSIPKSSEKVFLKIELFGYRRYIYDTYMTGKLFDYKKMLESEKENAYMVSSIRTAALYSLALVPGCCTNRLSVIQTLMGYKRAVSSKEGDEILYELLHLKTTNSTLEDLRSGAATWTPSGRSMTLEDEKKIRGLQMRLSKLIFEVRDHPIEVSNYFVFSGG